MQALRGIFGRSYVCMSRGNNLMVRLGTAGVVTTAVNLDFTIYHNSNCSKSRKALEYLKEKNIDSVMIIEYLKDKNAVNKDSLRGLMKALDISTPMDFIRINEEQFKEIENALNIGELSDDELLEYIVKYPILLQRPIIVNNQTEKAVIGRPTQNIDLLL